MANAGRVVFPAFSTGDYSEVEMRQFVSAVELRFQGLESDDESLFAEVEGGEFSLVGHTHVENEITDLQSYLVDLNSESIFDLLDVTGPPSDDDILVYSASASAFVAVPPSSGGGGVALNDLTDVSVPAPDDFQVLTYNDTTNVWEAAGSGTGITSLIDLTDTDLTGQNKYDMLFNATGSEWQDTNGKLQWNVDQQYMQLANAHSIKWLDFIGATQEMLQFEQTGVAGASVGHGETQILTEFLTTSQTFVDVTNAVIDQSSLVTGDEYLLQVYASYYNDDSTASQVFMQMVDESDVLLTGSGGSNQTISNSSTTTAQHYCYVNWFTASASGDEEIQLQGRKGTTGTNLGVSKIHMSALNLTQLPSHEKARSALTTVITGSTYIDLGSVSVTVGAGNWLFFCYMQCDTYDGNVSPNLGIDDGTAVVKLSARDITTSAETTVQSALYLREGVSSSTTFQLVGRSGSIISTTARFASIVAINLDDFNEYYAAQTPGETTPADASEFDLETLSFTTDTATSDWFFCGGMAQEVSGINDFGGYEVQADIGGAGDTLVSWDNTTKGRTQTNAEKTGFPLFPSATLPSIGSGVSVDADLKFTPESSSPTNNIIENSTLVAFPLALTSTTSERFFVGNNNFTTALLGQRVQMENATGFDWLNQADDSIELLKLDATDLFTVGDPLYNTEIDGLLTTFNGPTQFDDSVTLDSTLFMLERSAALADLGDYGQYWTRDNVPNSPRFTNDVSGDFTLNNVQEVDFEYSSTVTAADPGAGILRFDSVTIGSIANLYINDAMSTGQDYGWSLDNLGDGDILTITSEADPADYITASVNGAPTDNTGWWTIPLTLIHTGTIFTDTDNLRIGVQWFGSPFATPLNIIGDINTSTPPTTEALTGKLLIMDLAGDDELFSLGYEGSNTLYMRNRFQASGTGGFEFHLENSGGTDLTPINIEGGSTVSMDFQSSSGSLAVSGTANIVWTSNDAELRYSGDRRIRTLSDGVEIHGDLVNDPTTGGVQDTRITFVNDIAVLIGDIDWNSTINLGFFNRVHGGGMRFALEAASGGATIDAMLFTEDSGQVLVSQEIETAMTAFATGGQGSATQISSSHSIFSTVATIADSSKLPATFAKGTKCLVKNDGAADMDVFPSSGDDLGAGTDTAVSVVAGTGALFVATVVDATWTQVY